MDGTYASTELDSKLGIFLLCYKEQCIVSEYVKPALFYHQTLLESKRREMGVNWDKAWNPATTHSFVHIIVRSSWVSR
jgi:hypothetical protein